MKAQLGVSIVTADALVLKQHGISSKNTDSYTYHSCVISLHDHF